MCACLTTCPGHGDGIAVPATSSAGLRCRHLGQLRAVCTGSTGVAGDRYWCRLTATSTRTRPVVPDYMGYYANTTYKAYTGLPPYTITLTDKFITRIDRK